MIFRMLMTDMLGEMNSSHMVFTSNGEEERLQLSYTTLETGLIWSTANPYEVKRIVARGPSEHTGIDIRKGDELVAVDQVRDQQTAAPRLLFLSPGNGSGTAPHLQPEGPGV
jgi:hypothetical protein